MRRQDRLVLLSSKTNIVPWKTLWGKTFFSLGLQESEAHFSHEGLSLIFPAQVQQLLLQEKPCSLLPRFVFICWARQSTMCTRAGGERKRKKATASLYSSPAAAAAAADRGGGGRRGQKKWASEKKKRGKGTRDKSSSFCTPFVR